MLFNFQLKPITDISPFGSNDKLALHWFGLTDGWYWLQVGEEALFQLRDGAYLDYYVARLWEDLLDMLPAILEPVPQQVLRQCPPTRFADNAGDRWLNAGGDGDTLCMATGWLSDRTLDAGYLTHPPRIHFWSDGRQVHVAWDNTEYQEHGVSTWSATRGEIILPVQDFISEVRSFDARLMVAMTARVQSVRAYWPFPAVALDLGQLELEHRHRALWMERACDRVAQQDTNWNEVLAALARIIHVHHE